MKGIVLTTELEKLTILTNKGEFKQIRVPANHKFAIGEDIEVKAIGLFIKTFLSNVSINKQMKITLAIAAVFAFIMVIPLMNLYNDQLKVGYINIDINPSIELVYNKYSRIMDVKHLNQDGESLLNNISNKGLKLEKLDVSEALELIVFEAIEAKYITVEKRNEISIITTPLPVDDSKIKHQIDHELSLAQEKINEMLAPVPSVSVSYMNSDIATYDEAKERKISPGKIIKERAAIKHNDKANLELEEGQDKGEEMIEGQNRSDEMREEGQNKGEEMKEQGQDRGEKMQDRIIDDRPDGIEKANEKAEEKAEEKRRNSRRGILE